MRSWTGWGRLCPWLGREICRGGGVAAERCRESGDSPNPKNLRLRETFDLLSISNPASEELNCSPSLLDDLEDSQPPPLQEGGSVL
jgi:hypothetical protein